MTTTEDNLRRIQRIQNEASYLDRENARLIRPREIPELMSTNGTAAALSKLLRQARPGTYETNCAP